MARDLLSWVLGGEGRCGGDRLVWVMLSCSLVGVGVDIVGVDIVVAVVDEFELVSFCCDGDTVVLYQRAVVDKVELVSFWSDGDIIVLYQRAGSRSCIVVVRYRYDRTIPESSIQQSVMQYPSTFVEAVQPCDCVTVCVCKNPLQSHHHSIYTYLTYLTVISYPPAKLWIIPKYFAYSP